MKVFQCPEQITLIEDELSRILSSRQFASAPALQCFLTFVVNEAMAGRSNRIKAYTIATEAFGRDTQFDPANDTIVRTTAGRVRKALAAYHAEYADTRMPRVAILLPKGGYVPTFEFREAVEPQEAAKLQETLPPAATSHDQKPIINTTSAPDEPPRIRKFTFRPLTFATIGLCCLLTVLTICSIAFFQWTNKHESLSAYVTIDLLPTEYTSPGTETLARAVDIHLPLALRRIGLAAISPPGTALKTTPTESNASNTAFTLETRITEGADPTLLWQLIDEASGHLLWAAEEPITGRNSASLGNVADIVAFQLLGVNGIVPAALTQQHQGLFSRATCLFQARITETVENDTLYPRIRDCLESVVTHYPHDAPAWAALSTLYTTRSHFYSAGTYEERAELTGLAEYAAEKAVELAPEAYLTRIALMRLALRQGRVAEFYRLQHAMRAQYPGDIYLHIHIATRLARLGYGKEALQIFDRAEQGFGINLKNWAPGIAVAYFAEGMYEQAYHEMSRATSDLRFVLVLRAAILGKLNRSQDAKPILDQLVTRYPDINKTLYSWLTDIGWTAPLVLDIADGLAKLDFTVSLDGAEQIISLSNY